MAHVFISYVREESVVAEYLVNVLRANGVDVFWDHDIPAGRRWLDVVAEEIEAGRYFVPLYSRRWQAREKTVANEELLLARQQLRRIPRDRPWFVGLRIDDCALPNDPIGAGEVLSNLHFIDVPGLGWGVAIEHLLRAIGVAEPKLPGGDPIGPGLPGQVRITGGSLVFTDCVANVGSIPALNVFRGMRFFVSGGFVGRAPDGTVAAYVTTEAPNANLQALNVQVGLSAVVARSAEKYVSGDPSNPTPFRSVRTYSVNAGDLGFDASTASFVEAPFDMRSVISYAAQGALVGSCFIGKFDAEMDYGFVRFSLVGECELRLEPDYGPPIDFAEFEANLGERVKAE